MEEEELSLLHRSPEERTLPLVSVPAPNAMLTDSATDAENVKLTKMMKLLSRKYTVKAPKKPSGLKRGRKPKKETTTTESTPSNEEAVNSIIQDLLVKKSSATKKHQKKKPTVTREKNQSKSPENVINPLQKRKRGRPPKVKPDLSTTTKTPSRKGKVPDDEEMYFAFMQFLQKYNPAKRKKQLQAKKKDVRPKKEKSTLSKKKKSATQKKTKPSNPKKKSRPHYMFF
ncbi:hypothetical protein ADEAN_000643600 [Angomonas deanei]|uniref:Uncharacterized protein n=1 Tax=Angomonas deanei TaxID=59799 RepID=A0A7G2CK00_9TRYP|nr:hypothetical protein ADEAN_000643600 [Angomonas deanei]